MNDNTPKPLHERTWFSVTILVLAGLSALFGATGPILSSWSSRAPELLQVVTAFLSRFGLYLGLALFAAIVYSRRQTVRRWISWVANILRRAYGQLLGLALAPVLDSRRAPVVFGRRCVFRHFTTGHFLTSLLDQNYNHAGSSTQQIVFTTPIPDKNSIWVIEPELGNPQQRDVRGAIRDGEIVRVRHEASRSCLHSHINPAPSSSQPAAGTPVNDIQREVCASTQNNPEDNWRLGCGGDLTTGIKVRFTHTSTNFHLHSHDVPMSVAGRSCCFEVTCCVHRNDDDLWILIDIDRTRILVA